MWYVTARCGYWALCLCGLVPVWFESCESSNSSHRRGTHYRGHLLICTTCFIAPPCMHPYVYPEYETLYRVKDYIKVNELDRANDTIKFLVIYV